MITRARASDAKVTKGTSKYSWDNEQYQFTVQWEDEEPLSLDFYPLVKKLTERYHFSKRLAMIHWQARPKGARRWGVFVRKDDRNNETYYYAVDAVYFYGSVQTFQLDETEIKTLPSAILLMTNCVIQDLSDGVSTVLKISN